MTTPRDTEVEGSKTPTAPPPDEAAVDDSVLTAAESELVAESLGDYVRSWWKRVRGGESGVLPVLLGLVILVVIFQAQQSVLLGMAEVWVLLLGEIDLSVGFTAAIGAAVTVILSSSKGLPWPVAILGGLVVTAIIGTVFGLLVTLLRLPSFVVTLAGLLGLQGVLIWMIDTAGGSAGGTVAITNAVINGIVNGNMSTVLGWVMLVVAVVGYAALAVVRDRSRRHSGLATPPMGLTIAKIAVFTVAGVVLVAVCNTNRGALVPLHGVPWVVPIVLVILVIWTVLLSRTRFGRYVYAIGGNAEAARRAGVNLTRIRLGCFILASMTAGMGGVVYASRLGSISSNVNGGQLVLYAVAAAVIGGTSLFGGRGKMLHALLGGMVIATINNGMGLIGLAADTQLMVTALVLLAAVTVDSVARRGQVTG